MKKKICVSVSNDVFNDNRVLKTCHSLSSLGLDICLIGKQDRKNHIEENQIQRLLPNKTTVHYLKPLFRKNAFYYAELNIRLFFFLLFHRQDILWANDLDTLPANFLVSRIKRKPLIYDSHEMFCYTAELKEGSYQQKVWLFLERSILPKLKYVITVCDPIKDYFKERYNVNALVVRNIPLKNNTSKAKHYPLKDKYLVWQGAANKDRGLEELVLAMQYIQCKLYILGRGDVLPNIKQIIKAKHLEEKVFLLGRLPFDKMMSYSKNATLGISIDKPTNKNYAISLPNKIFEYINSATPVLSSELPEIKKIIDNYHTGVFLQSYQPQDLASQINALLLNNTLLEQLSYNCLKAQEELSWQKEQEKIVSIITPLL